MPCLDSEFVWRASRTLGSNLFAFSLGLDCLCIANSYNLHFLEFSNSDCNSSECNKCLTTLFPVIDIMVVVTVSCSIFRTEPGMAVLFLLEFFQRESILR